MVCKSTIYLRRWLLQDITEQQLFIILTDAKPQLQVETICTQSANFCQPAIERGFIPSKSIALTQGPCAKRLRQMAKLLRLQRTA